MWSFGEWFDVEDAAGNDHPYQAFCGVVFNFSTLRSRTWIDSIKYDDDRDVERDAVVSNAGEPAIVELVELDDDVYKVRVIVPTGEESRVVEHQYPSKSYKEDPLVPSQIMAAQHPTGDIVAVVRNLHDDELHSLERVRIDQTTFDIDFTVIAHFSETFVRRLTAGEEKEYDDDYHLVELLIHADSSYTPILERNFLFKGARNGPIGPHPYRHYGPIVITHFHPNDVFQMATVVDRDEYYQPYPLGEFEGGYAMRVVGMNLEFLLRQRELNGVMLYKVDLNGLGVKPADAKLVASLGNMAYFGRCYAAWSMQGDVFLCMKAGQYANDWQIMQVTP